MKAQTKEQATTTQMALPLPYAPLENIQGRTKIREEAKFGRQTHYIDRSKISYRENFNRIKPAGMSDEDFMEKLNIAQMAKDLLNNGQIEPLHGNLVKKEDGSYSFILSDGLRRYFAMGYLLEKGHTHYKDNPKGRAINEVEVMPNPSDWTEEDLIYVWLGTNTGKLAYDPIEIAEKLVAVKRTFLRSNQDIADRSGQSRQWVDNMVNLADDAETVKKAITSGHITPTAAAILRSEEKDPKKRADIVDKIVKDGDKLPVKDAADIVRYQKYPDLFQAEIDKYKDETITAELAATNINAIRDRAIELKIDAPDIITLKALNATDIIKDATDKYDWKTFMQAEKVNHKNRITGMDAALSNLITISAKAQVTYPDDIDAIYAFTTEMNIAIQKEETERPKIKVETQQAITAEQASRTTDGKFRDNTPKSSTDDALADIDFSADKLAGELDLNEAISLLDKLYGNIGTLPKNLDQNKKDWQGLIHLIQTKVTNGRDIIKKAANKR